MVMTSDLTLVTFSLLGTTPVFQTSTYKLVHSWDDNLDYGYLSNDTLKPILPNFFYTLMQERATYCTRRSVFKL